MPSAWKSARKRSGKLFSPCSAPAALADVQKEETLDEQEEKLYFALRERDQWMRQCLEAEAKAERFNEELLKVDYVLFDRLKYGPNNGTRAEIMSDVADTIESQKTDLRSAITERNLYREALLQVRECIPHSPETRAMIDAVLNRTEPKHERVFQGKGELERTGYLDPSIPGDDL
jgi:hypothetical protein